MTLPERPRRSPWLPAAMVLWLIATGSGMTMFWSYASALGADATAPLLWPAQRARADAEGVEMHRFGALTSGQTLVYDAAGRLLFSGGITASRGQGTTFAIRLPVRPVESAEEVAA